MWILIHKCDMGHVVYNPILVNITKSFERNSWTQKEGKMCVFINCDFFLCVIEKCAAKVKNLIENIYLQ